MSLQKTILAEEQKVLFYDPEKCSGCLFCVIACSFYHFGEISLEKSHVEVFSDLDRTSYFISAHCAHCEFPACESACPVNAIKKDPEKGIVKINTMECIGCKACNFGCPISIPHYDSAAKVSYKCDLCDGDPWCVKFCTTGAIQYLPRKEARKLVKTKTKT